MEGLLSMNEMEKQEGAGGSEILMKSLLEMAVEAWRFSKVFERVIMKLDAGETARYLGQYRWYIKRMEELLEDAECKLVIVEGHPYDPGMAVTPLNIDEFDQSDKLIVDQMLAPIIMRKNCLMKMGTVTLRKVEK